MPQGGIDPGEEAEEAAIRELGEETGIHGGLVEIIARSREEYFYDLPDHLVGKMWGGQYRGQRQHWFLMRFMGADSDVDIHTAHQEFRAWRWAELGEIEKLIVPFKRALYRALVEEFGPLV
jgi:putative (di)nucleoside polyphosphate hydrolase